MIKKTIFCIEFLCEINKRFITPIPNDQKHDCYPVNQIHLSRNRILFMPVTSCCVSDGKYRGGKCGQFAMNCTKHKHRLSTVSSNQFQILEATSRQFKRRIFLKSRIRLEERKNLFSYVTTFIHMLNDLSVKRYRSSCLGALLFLFYSPDDR